THTLRADSDCQPGDHQDDERKQREQPSAPLAPLEGTHHAVTQNAWPWARGDGEPVGLGEWFRRDGWSGSRGGKLLDGNARRVLGEGWSGQHGCEECATAGAAFISRSRRRAATRAARSLSLRHRTPPKAIYGAEAQYSGSRRRRAK